ncbi:hypothetical protein [Kitasatospora sp. NPDC059160]|uniref:hypothetical protein n=2 Tax=unclassified Kitasatospora TaxID=2633591 RepID=UPI0036B3C387
MQEQMTFEIADSIEPGHQGVGEVVDQVQVQLRAGVEACHLPVDSTGRTVRPGGLAVQDFFEQTHARRVVRVHQLGAWLAELISEVDGSTFTETCNRLRIVTREAVDALVRVEVEEHGHRGRVSEAIAGGKVGLFRVTCACSDWNELEEPGRSRAIAWRRSEAEARALFAEHAAPAGVPTPARQPPSPATEAARTGGTAAVDRAPVEAFAMVLESAPAPSVPRRRAVGGGGTPTWARMRPEAFGKVRTVQPVLFASGADAVGTGSLLDSDDLLHLA